MSNESLTTKLQELFELYQSGAITKEEFDILKAQLLQNKNTLVTIIPNDERTSLENHSSNTSAKEEPVTKENIDKGNTNSEGVLSVKHTAPLTANKTKISKRNYIGIVLILMFIIAGGMWMFMKVIGNHKDDIKDHIAWNNKYIEVTTFNDFNGEQVDFDHQKSFYCYGGESLFSDSNTNFGVEFLEDTIPKDHILYAFLDEAPVITKEHPNNDRKVISGLKIEHLNSSQINATISVQCENPNDKNSKYFTIVLDYKKDGKVVECKTYKFDFERRKIVQNTKDFVICKVEIGQD